MLHWHCNANKSLSVFGIIISRGMQRSPTSVWLQCSGSDSLVLGLSFTSFSPSLTGYVGKQPPARFRRTSIAIITLYPYLALQVFGSQNAYFDIYL